VQQHGADQREAPAHLDLGQLLGHALALGHAVVRLPEIAVAGIVLDIDDVVVEFFAQAQPEFLDALSNHGRATDQGGPRQAFVDHDLAGAQHALFLALGAAVLLAWTPASLLEPGTFDPAKMDTAAYPGIAIFTVMPGPLPAARAFDELLDTARAMAHRLGGQLQDERGAPLSVQRVFKLREEVVAFERTLGSAGGV